MSETAIPVSAGSGTNIAAYQDTSSNLRQVVVPGDQFFNTNLMPQGVSIMSNGGTFTYVIPATTNTVSVVNNTAGRICKVLVTTVGSAAMTFYDNNSAATGTIVGYIPASAALGTILDFNFPVINGITASASATNPGVTVSYVGTALVS